MKIGFGFLGRKARHGSCDTNLPFQAWPEKSKRRIRVLGQFTAFPAPVVGEKNKTTLVHTFKQDGACGGFSLGIGSSEDHGIGVRRPMVLDGAPQVEQCDADFSPAAGGLQTGGVFEPCLELSQGIGGESALIQRRFLIIFAESRQVHDHMERKAVRPRTTMHAAKVSRRALPQRTRIGVAVAQKSQSRSRHGATVK